MAGKLLKKPPMHGVTIRQLVEEVPEGHSMPGFEQKPVTLALPEGKNAIFRALVCGDPCPQVHWQGSHGNLVPSSKYQISSAPGSKEHVLQISKLTGEDTGLYRCIAVNVYGEAACSARLTVIEVGFRKKRKRPQEPQEDLGQQLMKHRMMLKKRASPPAAERKVPTEQVWQLLLTADRKDYERLCMKYGIMDFRGVLRRLQEMRRAQEDKMAQYVNAVSNLKHIKVSKEGIATFELDLDLKDSDSKIYLYKDGDMVRYGSDSQSKCFVRRLGKHCQFQIQDLWPQDAGIYQVRVEDADVFSTELEASSIPPRVMVPLAEARCEEQGDAVFQCVLSRPCPAAAWSFQQRPLQPSHKYEVSVSSDGLTHRLVVRGARLLDTGPYSLTTGLHSSSAWLVVEEGTEQGLPTTGADHQVQLPGAQTSEAPGSGSSRSSKGGRPSEQGGSPGGAGLQPPAGPGRGGLGGHGSSMMGDEGAADSGWGPGGAGEDLLEAEEGGASPHGQSQVPGRPHPQGEGPGSGHQADGSGDSDGDGRGGTAGSWHPRVGGLGSSEDGQGPLVGAQLGPGAAEGRQGSQPGPAGSRSGGEVTQEALQGGSLGEEGGRWGAPRAAGGGGMGLGGAGDRAAPGGPDTVQTPGGRGSGSKAGRAPEAGGFGGSGPPLEQMAAGKDLRDPPLSGGGGSPDAPKEGSWQEAGGRGPGEPGAGGRGYKAGPAESGGPGDEDRGVQGLQQAAGALGEAGEGGRSPRHPQSWGAGQRGAGEAESPGPGGDSRFSLSPSGAQHRPGVPGSGGGEGGVGGTQAAGLGGSGQEAGASGHRLVGSAGRGAQGSGGALGGTEGLSSEPDLREGTWSSRGRGPGGDLGSGAGFQGPGGGDSLRHFTGLSPEHGAGYGDSAGAPGAVGSGGAAGLRHGSGGPGPGPVHEAGMQPGAGDAARGQGVAGPEGLHSDCGLRSLGTAGTVGEGHVGAEPGGSGAKGTFGEGGSGATEVGSLSSAGIGSGRDGARGLGAGRGDDTQHPKAQAPPMEAGPETQGSSRPGSLLGSGDGAGTSGPAGGRIAHGGGSSGLGPGGVGSGAEVGLRDGSGGRGGLGSGAEVGLRDGSGGRGGLGSGAEVGLRDGSGGHGGLGSGAEVGLRDGSGGRGGLGPGAEVGLRDGSGGRGGLGLGAEVGLRDGSGGRGGLGLGAEVGLRDGSGGRGGLGPGAEVGLQDGSGGRGGLGPGAEVGLQDGSGSRGGLGPGAEVGLRDSSGGRGGLGPGAEVGLRDGSGGRGGLGPGAEVGLQDGSGSRGGLGPGAEVGLRDGSGGRGGVGSGAEVGLRDSSRGHGGVGSGASTGYRDGVGGADETGYRRDLGVPEGMGPGIKAGGRDCLGGSGSTLSGAEAGRRGGSGGSGETGQGREQGYGEGSRRFGAAGSPAGEGESGVREAVGHISGGRAASEGSYGGSSPQGGSDRSRGTGLANGGGPGAGAGMSGVGRGSETSPGGSVSSGAPGILGADGSEGKAGITEWQDGPGTLWHSSRERGSVDHGRVPAFGSPDGQGAVEGDAPASLPKGAGRKAGPGTADGGGAAGQGGRACRGAEESLRGGPDGRGASRALSEEGDTFRGREGAAGWRSRGSRGSGPGTGSSAGLGDSGGAWNGLEGPSGRRDSRDGLGDAQGSALGRGRRGGRVSLGQQGALKEGEGQGAEEAGQSHRRPHGDRSQLEARVGAPERGVAGEARGQGQPPTGGDGGYPEDAPHEDGPQKPLRVRRKGGPELGLDSVRGQESSVTPSPRPRRKPGSGDPAPQEFRDRAQGHFTQGLADTEARLGEDTVLSCILSRDLGPGSWFKDGVQLGNEDGLVFEQEGLVRRLLIAHVQGAQAGCYAFVVGDQKSEATLTVQDPPVIAPDVMDSLRQPLEVKAGKPLTVKVPFWSRLPVQATWQKDGAPVDGGSGRGAQVALGDGFTRLCLPSVSRRDGGLYSVTLKSQGGSARAQLTLRVVDKPQPPQGPLEVQDCQGAGVCLRWRPPRDDGGRAVEHYVVERRQAGRSTWLKVAQPPAGTTTLTDAEVERGRKYAFRVRAVSTEGAGDALESAEVLVASEAVPGPPSAPAILSASSQAITLTWTAPRGPRRVQVLGYLIEKCKKGSNTWAPVTDRPVSERKWTVMDLRPGCQYEFRVTAVAPAGPGEPGPPSEAVFARDPMRPPGPVRDLQVTETTHTSIALRWAPPDTQDGDEAQGYLVELCGSDSLQWSPCHPGTMPTTTYTAKGLRPRQGYFVRVTAVNDGGRGQPATLDMLVEAMPATVGPRFLVDSGTKDSLVVRAGDTIRVPVSFEAAPTPEVTWLKDGLPLTKRSVTSTRDGLTQLLVPVASLSDSGLYTVVLRTLQGTEATYSFRLRVAAHPQAPGPICLQENVPGTVTAEWEPSPDEARGVPLHYTVLTRSSGQGPWREVADRVHTNRFTLLGVVPGHEYHFRVVAKNELGASSPSDTSQPWCIPQRRDKPTVKAPSYREPSLRRKPWFLVGLRPHLLPAGCECCMSCAVGGWPRPHVTWFKDEQSLAGSRAAYSTDMLGVCSLVIPCVSPKDSGQYKAVAENTLGQAVTTATLIVTEPSS